MKEKETFESEMIEMIKSEAESMLEGELTKDECEDVYERVLSGLSELIWEKLDEFDEERELCERNKRAEKRKHYYKVIWKNPNNFVNNFRHIFSAKTLEDAKTYIKKQDFNPEFDTYRIIEVQNGQEEQLSYL